MNEALAWYHKAADQGYTPARNSLGVLYEEGRGVPQNLAKAIACHDTAPRGEFSLNNLRRPGAG